MQRLALIIGMCLALAVCAACSIGGGGGGGNTTSVCDQPTGVAYVGLAAQSTSYQGNTGIYNTGNGVADPLIWCQNKGAIITGVRNDSGYNFSLAHGGPGSPFIILNNGTSANVWNGQPVEGNYSAQFSGELKNAPPSLTVKVEWRQP